MDNEINMINLKITAIYANNKQREIIQTFSIINDIKIKVLSPLLININPLEDKDPGGYYKYFL